MDGNKLVQLECNVDDATPETMAYAAQRFLARIVSGGGSVARRATEKSLRGSQRGCRKDWR